MRLKYFLGLLFVCLAFAGMFATTTTEAPPAPDIENTITDFGISLDFAYMATLVSNRIEAPSTDVQPLSDQVTKSPVYLQNQRDRQPRDDEDDPPNLESWRNKQMLHRTHQRYFYRTDHDK